MRSAPRRIGSSVSPVGTTRGRIAAALERASGLTAERDFHVAFSPERVYSGRVLADMPPEAFFKDPAMIAAVVGTRPQTLRRIP